LLRFVGETLRANVRAYDVLVRYGGDEVLGALPDLTVAEATSRFEKIAAALASAETGHSVRFGIVEAEASDSLDDVIMRADAALLEARRSSQN
jgi:diguanylate cyclase (GGDEF)-like protein